MTHDDHDPDLFEPTCAACRAERDVQDLDEVASLAGFGMALHEDP